MSVRIAPSEVKTPAADSKTLSAEDQKALQAALDSFIQRALIDILNKNHQRIAEEFKESPDF